MSVNGYREWFRELEETPEYQTAGLEVEFTEELCRVMEERRMSRAELARRAGTSSAYITKILRGSTNFTLATMAKLALALGMEVRLHLAPRGSRTVWKDRLAASSTWPASSVAAETSLSSRDEPVEAPVAPPQPRSVAEGPAPIASFDVRASDWEGDDGETASDQAA